MTLFDTGDEVAVWHWNREKQEPYYKTGVVERNHDISHQIVRFHDDGELYLCHTSKIVSIKVVEPVDVIEPPEPLSQDVKQVVDAAKQDMNEVWNRVDGAYNKEEFDDGD